MPVTATLRYTSLQMKMYAGSDDKGNPIIRTKTYRSVKTTALDQNIYDVGFALAGLQMHPVESIRRLNEVQLAAE
ncbi:MAG TPA: DUF1659 domain-containing protein [Syntrophomonadaceae bacterium]|nr:DUF1659 domain-containing protein [Syntrophomonadaceae bacterium]